MAEIRKGYKETEIGVIPEDWEVKSLFDALEEFMDFRGRTPKKLKMDWSDEGIIALSALNVRMGKIDFTVDAKYGSEKLYKKWMTKGDLCKNDILFTMEAPLGNVALVPDYRKYILSQRVVALKVMDEINAIYLSYYMRGREFQTFLVNNATGSTAKGISQRNLKGAIIPIPPLKEQEKIAEILSTTDNHIEDLDRLIADYELLKKGMMQKLLTEGIGHTEFKDTEIGKIPKEWEVVKLKDTAEIIAGQSPSSDSYNKIGEGLPFYQGKTDFGDMHPTCTVWCSSPIKIAEKDDILISVRAPVGDVNINSERSCIGRGLCAIRAANDLDNYYLYYYFVKNKNSLDRVAQGSTFLAINTEDLKNYVISKPYKAEQEKMASILSSIDDHINQLKESKDNYTNLKQALMDRLLTGEIRVV